MQLYPHETEDSAINMGGSMLKRLEPIKTIALEAGSLIMAYYRQSQEVSYKVDKTPVTKADQVANDYIVKKLRHQYPDMAILAEESKDDLSRLKNPYCWLVDPLDGTKEFLRQNGEFTVNIALTYKGRAIMGVVYSPVLDEMYEGLSGHGAYLTINASKSKKTKRMRVSQRQHQLIMLKSRSHNTVFVDKIVQMHQGKIKDVIPMGSSLKGCWIAKGQGDVYYRSGPTMEWDTAAMQVIVEEAGGVIRQLDHSLLTYNREDTCNRKGFYILNRLDNKLMP